MSKITVRWEACDGCVGKDRPQRFSLDLDEMAENCDTEEDARAYLEREVQDDFDNKVSYDIDNAEEVIAAWREAKGQTAAPAGAGGGE